MGSRKETSKQNYSKCHSGRLQGELTQIESVLAALEEKYPSWRSWVYGSAYGDTPPDWFREMQRLRREQSAITVELVRRRELLASDSPASAPSNADTRKSKSKNRREIVKAYISEVLSKKGKRITKKDIWTRAGYKTRTEFERWERQDAKHPNRAAHDAFTRILTVEKPDLK